MPNDFPIFVLLVGAIALVLSVALIELLLAHPLISIIYMTVTSLILFLYLKERRRKGQRNDRT